MAIFIRVINDGFSEKQRREGTEDWSLGSLKKSTVRIEHQGPRACGGSVPGMDGHRTSKRLGWLGWVEPGEQSGRGDWETVWRETRMVPPGSLCKDFGFVL